MVLELLFKGDSLRVKTVSLPENLKQVESAVLLFRGELVTVGDELASSLVVSWL
jgi:hypothetical protein